MDNHRALRTWLVILALEFAVPCFAQQCWERIYGDTVANHEAHFALQTQDGGYMVVGDNVDRPGYGAHLYFPKTDANGDTLWTRSYSESRVSEGGWATQANDGGYVVVGVMEDSATTYEAPGLMKTDANGNLLWSHIYSDSLNPVCPVWGQRTSDGGYIIGGAIEFG